MERVEQQSDRLRPLNTGGFLIEHAGKIYRPDPLGIRMSLKDLVKIPAELNVVAEESGSPLRFIAGPDPESKFLPGVELVLGPDDPAGLWITRRELN